MKLCLIHPPIPFLNDRKVAPPLGILYIGAHLRNEMPEVETTILDQNLLDDISVEACVEQVLSVDADVYGLSYGTTQYEYVVTISKAIKKAHPKAIILHGGAHADALPAETLIDSGGDIVMASEGEISMLELMRTLDSGGDISEVLGLYYMEDGKLKFTGDRPLIRNLDDIPLPARDLVDMSEYTRTINGVAATPIITARGCPGKCIFCSQKMWRNRVRFRSVENIVAEIDEIYEKYDIRNILFLDDTLTASKKRMMALCKELKARKIQWRGWTRANSMDQELADTMADAGCLALCIGVESGSQTMLDTMKKQTSVDANARAIAEIKKSGMYARASLLIGTPGETWDTINETVDFVLETRPDDWILSVFVPVPGSEAYTDPDKFEMKIFDDRDRVDFFKDFFVVGGIMESGSVMEYKTLSNVEIQKMRDYMFDRLTAECPPKLYTPKGIQ